MILSGNPIIGLSGQWDRPYVTPFARPFVETEESPALVFRIDCIRISRVPRSVVPVAYQETNPVLIGDSGRMQRPAWTSPDRKSTRLNSSHRCISYAVFCL